uniref:NADH dehydrogenase [ubiquinone] 1 beta subcomplex subunit 3 n=1 Tax=Callorhinchus milii TaxID=7868 RepID=K4FSS4_CALMI|nr:NADH dehydrogenase [ubiquinone] 1 beta subcomplex subunit 3 [Callorhinchus milii]AFK11148.1 NADH dehydrogenase (ubiquinone) 1 beta subcomplex, 3 [Callorhinchus milii]AFM90505.1 NADH dehydrogenase (ubiquinone) 1 beta subcomplex, 3 [Callorhinchus milii]|eukprot:gi/632990056/ref/XP_007883978.1/ PREDICTED: NADH dehydrogenase [ubiquinone] 1 beta subcomplex subunit 3 [Callorhinchus milii]
MAVGAAAAPGARAAAPGHGAGRPVPPPWQLWTVTGTPLEQVQERLRRRGLSDPWARNEAWRFSGKFAQTSSFTNIMFRGFKWGFAAFVVALGVEYVLSPPKKDGGQH